MTPALREIMAEAREAEGYRMLLADIGASAAEMLGRNHVDVIVVDRMMPTLESCAFIGNCQGLRGGDVGLVCISAAARLQALRVTTCLAKPRELDGLVTCAAHVIDDVGRPRRARAIAVGSTSVSACSR